MITVLRLAALTLLTALLCTAPAGAIVGGAPAPPGQWPWLVGILQAQKSDATVAQFCGGAVIGTRRVLTAAHCVVGESTETIDVLVGRTRLSDTGGRRIPVTGISVYPGYLSEASPGLDAAVLTLASSPGVAPLALARSGSDAAQPGISAWTMGWGRLNARRSPGGGWYYADRLRQLQVPLQSDDTCEGVFGIGASDMPYRPAWSICIGAGDGKTGPCSGDSGAPLVVGGPGSWLDVGVLQGGDACASRGYYDLYTRVDKISAFALGALTSMKHVREGGSTGTSRRSAREHGSS